jgi:two-component system chemotaxis response regulator CheY
MGILIVDDASAIRRIVRGLLKELGFKNMREAENGRLAMEELKKRKTDFVVCDWNMPVMTGLDLVKAIRADDELKGMPVLMLTAAAEEENITKTVHAGITNYIVKPFNARTLEEKLNTIFSLNPEPPMQTQGRL